jgi:hypothetical protein
VVAQLRSSGELVTIGPGIDYAREAWEAVRGKVDTLAARGPLTARQVRDRLHTTRRHAEAILARWRAEHRGQRDRLGVQ